MLNKSFKLLSVVGALTLQTAMGSCVASENLPLNDEQINIVQSHALNVMQNQLKVMGVSDPHIQARLLNWVDSKGAFAVCFTSKANASIFYDKGFWQNYLSQRLQDVPRDIFGVDKPFIWVYLDAPEEKISKQQVSPARWIAEYLPILGVTNDQQDMTHALPKKLEEIENRLQSGKESECNINLLQEVKKSLIEHMTFPKSIELRMAFINNFDNLIANKTFMVTIGENQWKVEPGGREPEVTYIPQNGLQIIRLNMLLGALDYNEKKSWHTYYFSNSSYQQVGSGWISKVTTEEKPQN